MTMRVVYLKDHDGHKAEKEYFVERTLGIRLCENGVAMPAMDYEKMKKAEQPVEEKPEQPKEKPKSKKRRYKKTEKAVTIDK